MDTGSPSGSSPPGQRTGDSTALPIALLAPASSAPTYVPVPPARLYPRRRWWRTWSWLVLTALAVVAFGIALAFQRDDDVWHEAILRAFSIFPILGFPAPDAGNKTEFEIARYLASIFAVLLTIRIIAAVFSRRLTELRARWRRGHAVVCGLGEEGLRAARGFAAAGHRVTCIAPDDRGDAAVDARARGALVLQGDPTHVITLETARVDRAAAVVCASGDDAANARIAAHVVGMTARRRGRPLDVYMQMSNPELATLLHARALGLTAVRMQFFNLYELWARELLVAGLATAPWTPPTRRHQFVVLGASALAHALIVEIARWAYARRDSTDGGEPPLVTVVGTEAAAACELLRAHYPGLARSVDLETHAHPLGAAVPIDLTNLVDHDAPVAVYATTDDDAQNLTIALQLIQRLPASASMILPASAWASELTPLLFDRTRDIKVVSYSPEPDSLDLLRNSAREAIAREVYAEYLHSTARRDNAAATRAALAWAELDEDEKESNRRQVDRMVDHLRTLWYEVTPRYDWTLPVGELDDGAVDVLARLEHERWLVEKRDQGYTYAATKDDAARTHPLLHEWPDLPREALDLNRAIVRAWPNVLGRAGYEVVRSPVRERLAHAMHEQYIADRLAQGDTSEANASLVPWQELPEPTRELNRTAADDLLRKLRHVGCAVAPMGLERSAFEFADDELEELAELEHDRWCKLRAAQGWTHALVRDDDARTHPDLVPWTELPEERREIDRGQVRAIPDLLATVGLQVVRLDRDR